MKSCTTSCTLLLLMVLVLQLVAAVPECTLMDHLTCALPQFTSTQLDCVNPASANNCDPATYGSQVCVADKWNTTYQCYFFTRGCDPTNTGPDKSCTSIFGPLCVNQPGFTTWLCDLQEWYQGQFNDTTTTPSPPPPPPLNATENGAVRALGSSCVGGLLSALLALLLAVAAL